VTPKDKRNKHQDEIRHAQEKRRKEKQKDMSQPGPQPLCPPTSARVSTSSAQATPPIAAPATGSSLQQGWRGRTLRWFKFTWRNLGGAAFILALLGLWYTHRQSQISAEQLEELKRQNNIAEYVQLRQTGAITPQIELAAAGPGPEHFGKHMRTNAFGVPDWPYYKDLEAFISLPPKLAMNNIGDEPIEAIRLATTCFHFELDGKEKKVIPRPTVVVPLREEEREEIALTEQWPTNSSIQVAAPRGVLAQMLQFSTVGDPDAVHKAMMQIQIAAKITGGPSFMKLSDERRYVWLIVSWTPRGFPQDKCREFLNSYQPRIRYGPKMDRTLVILAIPWCDTRWSCGKSRKRRKIGFS
jgi:hypothetical protein